MYIFNKEKEFYLNQRLASKNNWALTDDDFKLLEAEFRKYFKDDVLELMFNPEKLNSNKVL